MKKNWNDQDITRALRGLGKPSGQEPWKDRVWLKLETRLWERRKPVLGFTWKPWGHPVRWVMAAACLAVALSGVLLRQSSLEQTEVASYLLSVSEPVEDISKDSGVVQVADILNDAPSSSGDLILEEEAHTDSPVSDEVLL